MRPERKKKKKHRSSSSSSSILLVGRSSCLLARSLCKATEQAQLPERVSTNSIKEDFASGIIQAVPSFATAGLGLCAENDLHLTVLLVEP